VAKAHQWAGRAVHSPTFLGDYQSSATAEGALLQASATFESRVVA